MPSPFDLTTFLETSYTGQIDTKWHNVDDGWTGLAQLKEFSNGMEMDSDKFNGRAVISAKINWVLQDEDMKARLGMTELLVQQDCLIELTAPQSSGGIIDWGINKNMTLKRLMDAFGLADKKSRNLAMFLQQVAWVEVKNSPAKASASNPSPDPTILYSRVVKVSPMEAGRAAAAAA